MHNRPLTINDVFNAVTGLQKEIQAMSASGTITVEQQAAVAAKYQALIGADAFSGPEWQQD